MTGTIFVKRLNPSGFHVSEADTDRCFVSDKNPTGYFKMVIEPLDGTQGPFIKYKKTKGGYLIEGEGYIIAGSNEEVSKKIRQRRRNYDPIGKVIFIEQEETINDKRKV